MHRRTRSRLFQKSVLFLIAQAVLWAPRGIAQNQPVEAADTTAAAQGSLLPLPIIYYTPETGVAVGGAILMVHRAEGSAPESRPSSVLLDLIFTQKKQIIAEIFPDLYLADGMYHLVGSVHYSKYPQKFYGIGNNMPESFEEDYTSRAFRVVVDALRTIEGALSAGPSVYYEERSLSGMELNGMLQAETIPGSRGGRTLGAGGIVQWDTRDNIFSPSAGGYYVASLKTSVPGSDFKFSYTNIDLRHYLPVSGTSTLAVQAAAILTAGTPPFFMLAQLGGANIMRGYYEGRYRDKKLLAVQTEYRFPIFWRFGGAAFAGAGDVARSLGRFSINSIKPSYGFGLRYLFDTDEKMNLRLDIGFGKASSGLYITANEAF